MEFSFLPDYESDIREYRSFGEEKITPLFQQMEEAQETPKALLDEMKEAALFGVPIAKEYGGSGKDYVSATLLMEILSEYNPSVPGIVNVSTEIVGGSLEKFGTEEQKQKYLTPLAKGETIGAFALTEPEAGSDTAGVKTVAVDRGDHWVLNGTKCFITNAEIADTFLIAALTDIGEGKKKISMFIVEKDYPGFRVGKHEDKMGIRSSSTCELVLDDCVVPKENLLGELGKGIRIALGGLDGGRVMIAAQGLGIAQGCWDACVAYLKDHTEETGSAINHQRVQFRLAELQTKIDAARLLVYRAASFWSQGKPFGKEAAMAKYYATDVANEVTRAVTDLMGTEGVTLGSRTEQFFRDAKITEIYEGTNEIQLLVIAGQLQLKA